MSKTYYIGWDLGAWSCAASSKSCDALVILDESGELVGEYFRQKEIKSILNEAKDTEQFLKRFFECCELTYKDENVVLAIDTPLGYSESFVKLITEYKPSAEIFGKYRENSYLFRKTEKHIFKERIINPVNKLVRPLSAVNDMIGAQSTKGIHVISKYAPNFKNVGVWKSDDEKLSIIETYPSVNRKIEIPEVLKDQNDDIKDAYICAIIAYVFSTDKKRLVDIPEDLEVPVIEGWIWYLKK
jgi:hypothetical protein